MLTELCCRVDSFFPSHFSFPSSSLLVLPSRYGVPSSSLPPPVRGCVFVRSLVFVVRVRRARRIICRFALRARRVRFVRWCMLLLTSAVRARFCSLVVRVRFRSVYFLFLGMRVCSCRHGRCLSFIMGVRVRVSSSVRGRWYLSSSRRGSSYDMFSPSLLTVRGILSLCRGQNASSH